MNKNKTVCKKKEQILNMHTKLHVLYKVRIIINNTANLVEQAIKTITNIIKLLCFFIANIPSSNTVLFSLVLRWFFCIIVRSLALRLFLLILIYLHAIFVLWCCFFFNSLWYFDDDGSGQFDKTGDKGWRQILRHLFTIEKIQT